MKPIRRSSRLPRRDDSAPPQPLLGFDELRHYEWLQLPMWVFDADRSAIPWANEAGLVFWRATTGDELAARDFSDISPAARERLVASMAQHAQGRLVRESWTLYPRDEPLTSELVSRGVRLPDGRPAILFASEPLAASYDASMLRGLEALRHAAVRVALHRIDGGPALMRNPAALAAFGPIDGADAQPEPTLDALLVEPALTEAIVETVRDGQAYAGEALLRTRDGERWHAIDARAVRDPVTGNAVLQFNARDISDLKAALAALEAARDAAEAANRAKSAFLANMSHELRTPMNGVLNLTRLVLETRLEPRQRHFLELSLQSAQGLMQIIDDVLDLSKIEADKMQLAPLPVSLNEVLRGALAPLQVQATQRGLAFDWTIDADVPDAVVADAPRWRQILLNLAGNALKFTEQGGVRVHLQKLAADASHALLACSVKDSGIGMTAEQLAVVFEPFTQADSSVTRRYGGTGLGLSIVRRLVQLMGGRIEVDSHPGVGSCFRFVVPVGIA
ncbi:hybrid sensor histidine kinase/response regulator [Aquabacterium humicola]|uniref:hybrid sensor histidine kinase/response regulator n=1 Tax=Aquabacterium humicola TaxID=3237377 RepID=UPI002543F168|nr:PAS domain-containing hybrid sensor histidine kinase/response regulator [Rubrivivax pictus]